MSLGGAHLILIAYQGDYATPSIFGHCDISNVVQNGNLAAKPGQYELVAGYIVILTFRPV